MKLNSTQSLALVKAVIKTKPLSTKNVMAMVNHFINSGELPPHIEKTKIPSWLKVEEFAEQLITAALNWEADKNLVSRIVNTKCDFLTDNKCYPKHGGPATYDFDAWLTVQGLVTNDNKIKLFDPKKIKDEVEYLSSFGYRLTEEWYAPIEDLIDAEPPYDN